MAFMQPQHCILPTLRVAAQPGHQLKGHPAPPGRAHGLAASSRICSHWQHLSRQGTASTGA
eukprot:4591498-Alexandrium_andersonii.AAC.1